MLSGISRLRIQRQYHVSLDFELSTNEACMPSNFPLVHGCAQCSGSGWRVSSNSELQVWHRVSHGVVICCVTIARSATMRTDHQVRVCDFLSVSGSFMPVACSGVMCSCVQSSHPRPSHCVGTGVPSVSMPGPRPPTPRRDGIGDKAPTLCCACVASSSWHAHLTIWNCGVGNMCADCHEMSARPLNIVDSSVYAVYWLTTGTWWMLRERMDKGTVVPMENPIHSVVTERR